MAIIEHPEPLPNGRRPLPRLVGHGCFACGTENPIGLKMRFYLLSPELHADMERLFAAVETLPDRTSGAPT